MYLEADNLHILYLDGKLLKLGTFNLRMIIYAKLQIRAKEHESCPQTSFVATTVAAGCHFPSGF